MIGSISHTALASLFRGSNSSLFVPYEIRPSLQKCRFRLALSGLIYSSSLQDAMRPFAKLQAFLINAGSGLNRDKCRIPTTGYFRPSIVATKL